MQIKGKFLDNVTHIVECCAEAGCRPLCQCHLIPVLGNECEAVLGLMGATVVVLYYAT